MIKILLCSVVYRAVGEGGCIAFLNLADNHIAAGYVQVGILLACEGSIRQIFCCCRGTDCHVGIFFIDLACQFFIGIADGLCQIFRHFRRNDGFADFRAHIVKLYGIIHVAQFAQQFMDLCILSRLFHEIPISMSRCRISVGNGNTGGGGQFTQGGGFPAYQVHVLSVQFVKPQNISIFSCVHHSPPYGLK